VSCETSFDSKQPKLEPKLVSILSETSCLFRLFGFYIETACFGSTKTKQKTTETNRKKREKYTSWVDCVRQVPKSFVPFIILYGRNHTIFYAVSYTICPRFLYGLRNTIFFYSKDVNVSSVRKKIHGSGAGSGSVGPKTSGSADPDPRRAKTSGSADPEWRIRIRIGGSGTGRRQFRIRFVLY
jgi:hypothetical protein